MEMSSADLQQYQKTDYILETGNQVSVFGRELLIIATIIVVASLFLYLYTRRPKKRFSKGTRYAIKQFSIIQLLLGLTMILFIFFRYQGVKYLDMRLWMIILALALVVNFIVLIARILLLKKTSDQIQKNSGSEEFNKYLPKRNKKKKK